MQMTRFRDLASRMSAFMLCLSIVGTLVLAPSISHAASAKKPTYPTIEPSNEVRNATVNLYCRFKSGNKIISASGSGVFIDPKGVILTNAHVAQYFLLAKRNKKLKGDCQIRTGSPAREAYEADVLYIPIKWLEDNKKEMSKKTPGGTGENDFALLYVTASTRELPTQFPFLPIETLGQAIENSVVTMAGYPIENLKFDAIKNRLPLIAATTTITGTSNFTPRYEIYRTVDRITLAPSATGAHGISGGPIISMDGKVIGIASIKNEGKDDRTIRAITIPYIDKAIASQTFLPLAIQISGNFSGRSKLTNIAVTDEMIAAIARSVTKKR